MSRPVRVPLRPGTFQARVAGAVFGLLTSLVLARPAMAHGGPDLPPLDVRTALSTWSADALPWLLVLVGLAGYLALVRQVDRMHPRHPVPRWRVACWLGGLVAIALALGSSIDVYATTLFSVHMVQHLLLAFVAPPLLALGAPVTLLMRASPAGGRRRWLLPVLHSVPVRLVAHPVVAWLAFTGVMWVTHFSPLFDAALEDATVHAGEHLLYLVVGLLFWWPVVAADPVPWRMSYPARIAYLGLAFPQNTFLGLAIFTAGTPLYRHYATSARPWGPDPLTDQQLAGGLMWAIGDLLFIVPLLLLLAAWLRAEEQRGKRIDARLDREAAAMAAPLARPSTRSPPASSSGDTADGSFEG